MSDISPPASFLEHKLSIERASFQYAKQIKAKPVIMALAIPFPLWRAWYEYIDTQKKKTRSLKEPLTEQSLSKYNRMLDSKFEKR